MVVAILRQVCDLGYVVVVRAGSGGLELVAMEAGGTNWSHAVRVDERGDNGLYEAACALAVAVGIELEDG